MSKIGLKLWSINTDFYLEEAKRLYKEDWFDYIELYIVPGTFETLNKWLTLKDEFNIPFMLHAPHFANDVNLAKKEYEKANLKAYDEVKRFANALNPSHIVIHGGMDGTIEETIRQLKIVQLDKMLIENKPLNAPIGTKKICRGATIEEIQKIISEIGCGFCLDVSHALCTAVSFKLEPYNFLTEFNKLKPDCYHISDGHITSDIDSHLNFGRGDYNFKSIFKIIDKSKNIAIETKKASKIDLLDFKKDVKFIREIVKEVK